MPSTTLLRLGGLSAVLGSILFLMVHLINLFVNLSFSGPDEFGEGATTALTIQSVLALSGGVLVALGLVGLYLHQAGDAGILGLIGFLLVFVGIFFAAGIILSALLAYLGWALFGVSSLKAWAYPRVSAILLVVGALVSGTTNALVGVPGGILMDLGVGTESIFNAVMYVGIAAEIVLYATVAWMGVVLWKKSSQAARQTGSA